MEIKKEFIQKLKENLEKEKLSIEKELQRFAKKDEKPTGDWDTRFPQWNGETGGSALEQAADQVEEYANLLPIEHRLELKLRDINLALEKIKSGKSGKYGNCEKCGNKISQNRIKVSPEARLCSKCNK